MRKAKEVVDVDEETEIAEELVIIVVKSIVRYVDDRVKYKKKEKYIPLKTSMKNTGIVNKKTPQEKHVNKKRKVEEKTAEKKSLKRKLVQTSEYEKNDEEYVLEIVPIVRRKIKGKRILVSVSSTPMDNVSFHSESNVQKWKYVFQIRIAQEKRELSKQALEFK